MVGDAVQEGGGHLGVAEDPHPFAEVEVGGGDERGLLVEDGVLAETLTRSAVLARVREYFRHRTTEGGRHAG